MTTRPVYNFEALTYAINRDNAILLHNYNKITKRTTIYFRCHCAEESSKGYKEEDIISDRKDIPRISYKIGDKQKYYFPDIYIPSKNKIIEVKSTWTYKCKKDNIQEKAEATKVAGYEYEVWIYDSKANKILK